MDNQNVALRRALSVGADLRTRDRAKLSIAQIDHLALMDEIERLREENRRLLTGDRVVYFPCKEHMGMPFTMTVGFAPPTMCRCPICEPPSSPLSAQPESVDG